MKIRGNSPDFLHVLLSLDRLGFHRLGPSCNEDSAVLFQPLLGHSVIGEHPFHFCPETGGVVHFFSVAQLVNHNIVNDLGRSQHQQQIKVQIARSRAAAPTGFLPANGDSSIGDPYFRCKVLNSLGNVAVGSGGELLNLFLCQMGQGREGLNLSEILLNPGGFAFHKFLDFF